MKSEIEKIVQGSLCVGCGACEYYYGCDKVRMVLSDSRGYRPKQLGKISPGDSMFFCPAKSMTTPWAENKTEVEKPLQKKIGFYHEIYVGYAANKDIQRKGSSGGVLTALSSYAMEEEDYDGVLHSVKDEENPWRNINRLSTNSTDLLNNMGSRYISSMPCQSLHSLDNYKGKSVFIGKPCDNAAIYSLRKRDQNLDRKIGITLSFFCAGTPAENGIFALAREKGLDSKNITSVEYRGNGWPGYFTMKDRAGRLLKLTYEESWAFLQKYRDFCCHLCPDGLGEFSDISCGDAWHLYEGGGESICPGKSLIIVRTKRGKLFLEKAISKEYIVAEKVDPITVVHAQGLIERRSQIWGRRLSRKILFLPNNRLKGFFLFRNWIDLSFADKIKSVIGTISRIFKKKIYKNRKV